MSTLVKIILAIVLQIAHVGEHTNKAISHFHTTVKTQHDLQDLNPLYIITEEELTKAYLEISKSI